MKQLFIDYNSRKLKIDEKDVTENVVVVLPTSTGWNICFQAKDADLNSKDIKYLYIEIRDTP